MIRLLAVDDEPLNLSILVEFLSEAGYRVDQATDGEEAWSCMQKSRYDLIILDRMMPRLDGLTLLRRLKADAAWASVPVIMQTAAIAQEQIREGLDAGAYYYLTKPYTPEVLTALVRTVVSELQERERLREASTTLRATLALLEHGEFVFRTLEEARRLAAALAVRCRDDMATGLGLLELVVNAVEHGNLGITYAEKSRLRQSGEWEDEIARRLVQEPWCHRHARLVMRREGGEVEFTITDQGAGFDWKPYLQLDPARAFDLNGRGIAMAKMLGFSSLEYRGAGNIVVARTTATA